MSVPGMLRSHRGVTLLVAALGCTLLGPILVRPPSAHTFAGRSVIIITPNNEAIRSEFGRAFAEDYFARTGERVSVDWRTPGGTSEIARYVDSEYVASFQRHWTQRLGRSWSGAVQASFMDKNVALPADPAADSESQRARRAYLASEVGCGIDLLFGGGTFDHKKQAANGTIVESGVVQAHPEILGPGGIPQSAGGETYWDKEGRWVGTCLSAFGICANRDVLERLGIHVAPQHWSDLADPRLRGQIALANPMQSGSIATAFEMMVQEQMLARTSVATESPDAQAAALQQGWAAAMRQFMRIGGNARYFTDAAGKVALDVGSGEAAAGLSIDFYGRFESETVRRPDGTSRLQYHDAVGGTSVSADAISMFRGAPHRELARAFIEWTLTPAAQKLWNFRPGTPGGPVRYALRRLPILPELYAPEWRSFRSDPDVRPYETSARFVYHGAWTGPLFNTIAFVVRVMCIDPHDELRTAWTALIDAHFPPEATAAFEDVHAVDYPVASGRLRASLAGSKIGQVQLAKELAEGFRAQYRAVTLLARAGR